MAPPGVSSLDGFKEQTGMCMRQAEKPWAAVGVAKHTEIQEVLLITLHHLVSRVAWVCHKTQHLPLLPAPHCPDHVTLCNGTAAEPLSPYL